ncbi:MMPL family transporter [Actinokineospora auranticolor]|uniref:RND superfamily putative drug exporter n=1 Tax=Actinokineospora auranticolor TaxID=155976 RepID=A0A2S6GKE4_9PSEU|nr:MMPL family transporter [Actinokineospora auranticolor]PPK65689.1 RND superfamily putative drug exporter [Actinokineospora auranticolor]
MGESMSSVGADRVALVERIAAWSVRNRWRAIGGWLVFVVVTVALSVLVQGADARATDPGESGRAQTTLDAQGSYDAIRENVLVQARAPGGAFVDSPPLRAAADDLVNSLRARENAVAEVRSPTAPDGGDLISADGRSALVAFRVAEPVERVRANFAGAAAVVDAVAARHPDVRVVMAGDRSLTSAVDATVKADLARSHLLSAPVVVLILVVVFGSLVAVGIPVLLTVTGLAATFSLLALIGKVMPINSASSSLILLIGIAIGVDYSLFSLRRYREERHAGRDRDAALRITARTSGHVVVVSGLTVVLCLVGLLITGLDAFRGATVATAVVVGVSVTGAVVVLPAILSLLGDRVDRWRVPFLGRGRVAARESRVWSRIAHRVVRRPLLLGGAAVAVLVVLALPALGMRLQDAAVVNSLPREVAAVDNAIRLQEAFPGSAAPTRVVVWNRDGSPVDSPRLREAVAELRSCAGADQPIHEPIAVAAVDRALVIRVPVSGSGTDDTTVRALERLRAELLPATIGRVDGVDFAVGGKAAQTHDFTERVAERTPWVFAFVLVLAFALLAAVFRSVAISLVSIVLNLLAIAAACGVVTWIFQDGNLSALLGFTPYGGVMDWLPLFVFVVLFGLSMDYHIFILSRIRERLGTGDLLRAAIVGGIESSAGVVTSAAVIMTAVFAVFVTLTSIENKQLGVGMGMAVILDATIVRGVLLPATLSLLGDGAWKRALRRKAGTAV